MLFDKEELQNILYDDVRNIIFNNLHEMILYEKYYKSIIDPLNNMILVNNKMMDVFGNDQPDDILLSRFKMFLTFSDEKLFQEYMNLF
jgi:hypothetical protein